MAKLKDIAKLAPISKRAGEWPATGVARFDQKTIESSAWQGWTANLERQGIRVGPNPDLPAGNPGSYIPGMRVLEYSPFNMSFHPAR